MTDPQHEPFYIRLKKKREHQNIELNEIAERTKINPKYLYSFEEGDFETLPLVYTRLFLRSYAIEIGADAQQVLEDFEIHTTGKIQPKNVSAVNEEIPVENVNTDEDSIFEPTIFPQFDQKKLIAIGVAFIMLFILASWVRNLSQSTLENSSETNGGPSINHSITADKINTSTSPDQFLAKNAELDEKTINLGIKSPYHLEVKSLVDSKINIRIVENGVTTLERVSSLPINHKRSWDSTGMLQFELPSVQGINITLNGNERIISQFLKPDNISEDDVAIRVILEEDGNLTAVYFSVN